MSSLFPITTARARLRSFKPEDAAARFALDSDQCIQRYLGGPVSAEGSAARLQRDIAEFERDGYGVVAIAELETDRVIGYAGLQKPESEDQAGLELFVALRSEARGQGLGSEVAEALINVARDMLKVPRILGRVDPGNEQSLFLLRKMGMVKTGERRDAWGRLEHIYALSCGGQP